MLSFDKNKKSKFKYLIIDSKNKCLVSRDQVKKFFNFKTSYVKEDWCNIVFDNFIIKHNPYFRKTKLPFFV